MASNYNEVSSFGDHAWAVSLSEFGLERPDPVLDTTRVTMLVVMLILNVVVFAMMEIAESKVDVWVEL